MKREINPKVYIVGFILLILITLLAIGGASSGMSGSSNSNSNGIKEYRSIDELIDNTGFKLSMPNFVYNYTGDIIKISSVMGQIVEIDTNDFVYKASPLVSYNADILGMYENANKDYMYTVENNKDGVVFLRYRLGYPEYEHCTLINWCTSETTHGVIIGKEMNENEILELFDIQKETLRETSTEEILALESGNITSNKTTETTETNLQYQRYEIGNKFSIELPIFESNVSMIDSEGVCIVYLDKMMILAIIYNDYDIDNNTFDGQSELKIDNNVTIKYRDKNPFSKEHIDYNTYNLFLENINHIKESIIYL